MTFSIGGLFAEAASLWRRERELIVPLTGMFAFVPMLGFVLMIAGLDIPPSSSMDEVMAAIQAFQSANAVPLILGNVALSFGGFATFNLFLQGDGRTLGEVLKLTLRRFLPFLAIDLILSFVFGLGLSLFLLPGLFFLGRTWLIAPAFAARPEAGPLGAARSGWRQAAGTRWLVLLLCAGMVLLAALALLFGASLCAALLIRLTVGGPAGLHAGIGLFGHVVTAAIGALAWTQLNVLRVAAYRLSEPRQGI